MVKPIDMKTVEQQLAGFTIPPQPEVLLRIKQEIEQVRVVALINQCQ